MDIFYSLLTYFLIVSFIVLTYYFIFYALVRKDDIVEKGMLILSFSTGLLLFLILKNIQFDVFMKLHDIPYIILFTIFISTGFLLTSSFIYMLMSSKHEKVNYGIMFGISFFSLYLTDYYINILDSDGSYEGKGGIELLASYFLGVIVAILTKIDFIRIMLVDAKNTNINKKRHFEFYNLYSPDNTDRKSVINLLNEAVVFINKETKITYHAKEKLVERIEKIKKSAQMEHPHWTDTLGMLKEVIIVLGAIGSLVGGVVSITSAQEKLQEAENIISTTCINKHIEFKDNVYIIHTDK